MQVEKQSYTSGWSLGIETTGGLVGLHNYPGGRRLFLGFPKTILVPEAMVIKTLKVEKGREVTSIIPMIAPSLISNGPLGEPEVATEIDPNGMFVMYFDMGKRKWGRYMGPIEPTGGRVWIDYANFCSYAYAFPQMTEDGFEQVSYGHDLSWNIYTIESSTFNKYAPDGPTRNPRAVQGFCDRFIDLAINIAEICGKVTRVNINHGPNGSSVPNNITSFPIDASQDMAELIHNRLIP